MVIEDILSFQDLPILLLVDNNRSVTSPLTGVELVYGEFGLDNWLADKEPTEYYFVVAIGGNNGVARYDIQQLLKRKGLRVYTAIHPTAIISKSSAIGEGSQVLAGAIICARVKIGEACIINTGASVDHESVIGNGVHLAPGVTTAGLVEIEDYSFIGTNATILPRIKIGRKAVVGAGSVVTQNVPDNTVCYGVPALVKRVND